MKESWEMKKLGDVADITDYVANGSFATLRENVSYLNEPGYAILVRLADYTNNFDKSKFVYIDEHAYNFLAKSKLYGGEIIMSNVGSIGKSFICPDLGMPMSLAPNSIVIKTSYNPFYYYLFQSSYFQIELKGISSQTALPKFNKTSFKKINISVPAIAEQEKIVAELDCLSGIIEKKKQQLKEYDALAQSIFYEMFIPVNGTLIKLSQACSIVSGLVNPNEAPYCNYPHIGGANIKSNTGEFINVKLAKDENLISGKYFFDNTMILYSKIRPNLNKVALPSFCGICSADMYPIIPTNGFNKIFLKFILTQKDFLEYAVSHSGRANIPKINRGDLLEYEFLSYPLSAQQEFALKIEAIEKQKALIKKSIEEVETLFNSRMNEYFN